MNKPLAELTRVWLLKAHSDLHTAHIRSAVWRTDILTPEFTTASKPQKKH
jgi:hypothetical protein